MVLKYKNFTPVFDFFTQDQISMNYNLCESQNYAHIHDVWYVKRRHLTCLIGLNLALCKIIKIVQRSCILKSKFKEHVKKIYI